MLTRRELLLASAFGLHACTRRDPPAPSAPPATSPPRAPSASAALAPTEAPDAEPSRVVVALEEWRLPAPIERAVLVVPTLPQGHAPLPVVVALHGRGEAMKGPEEGSRGWARDYALVRAYERISSPPLFAPDFEGLVEPGELAKMNAALAARPFRGLAVLCPYVPDIDLDSPKDQEAYGLALVRTLLPRARADARLHVAPETTGIDGVSLGGAIALRAGLGHPEAFGAVAALQPAIRESQTPSWVALAKSARAARPGVKLRLTTSHEDYFLAPTRRVSEAWRAAGIEHDFAELPGPHDYIFNRGPGAMTLLFWQDRALSGA